MKIKHSVTTYRSAGLEARWGRTRNGAPAIFIRNPNAALSHQRTAWWMVTAGMFNAMQRDGIIPAFENHTLVGDIFSIPA